MSVKESNVCDQQFSRFQTSKPKNDPYVVMGHASFLNLLKFRCVDCRIVPCCCYKHQLVLGFVDISQSVPSTSLEIPLLSIYDNKYSTILIEYKVRGSEPFDVIAIYNRENFLPICEFTVDL